MSGQGMPHLTWHVSLFTDITPKDQGVRASRQAVLDMQGDVSCGTEEAFVGGVSCRHTQLLCRLSAAAHTMHAHGFKTP
jgi:hypothetical protein